MVKNLTKSILEFLFPPACPLCGAPVSIHGELCADCWTSFNWIDGSKCVRCGFPFAMSVDADMMCPVCASGRCELDWIRSACIYDDASKMAMLPFKHCGRIGYSNFMARAMIWALRDIDTSDIDFIMPVPLARRRLFKRGYNQATLLARPIARALGLKIDYDSVTRKHRRDMGHLNARERARNIHGVFNVARPQSIRGKNILLVDDVMTSGATFSELRRVLINAGAANVYGVTFCRVVRAN